MGRVVQFMLLLLVLLPPAALAEGYTVEAVPDWVKPVPAFDSETPVASEPYQGYHARLQDVQYNALQIGQSQVFRAFEYTLSNSFGVERNSSIEISFDPGYESLRLHELWILRAGVLLDKLPTARLDMLRADSERDELIHDGTRTLAIALDDVRVGDKVRYSYTVEGENPVFEGYREIAVSTELWRALDRNHTRILTSMKHPFSRRVRGADVVVQIKESDGVQELIVDQLALPEFSLEDDVPSWHYNRGTIVFSDMADWRSVVDWARPMYQLDEQSDPDIITIASVIRSSQSDVKGQIGAALRWVQEEVRYLGIELGRNSHSPTPPAETLARRYGDCKDKSLLLMALLRELGVDAEAALVNTGGGLESSSYPHRLHAFNHVLVHVRLDGKVHYLDPSLRNQAGALGELREPDYGRALVLSADTTSLSTMPSRQVSYRMSVNKTLATEGMGSRLTVHTSKHGRWAENQRLSVIFRYRTTANEVAAEQLSDYAAIVRQVYDLASFDLEEKPSLGAAMKVVASDVVRTGSLHPMVLLLLVFSRFCHRVSRVE